VQITKSHDAGDNLIVFAYVTRNS